MITPSNVESLYKLYPQVIKTINDNAYDANGNKVAYDLQAVTTQAQADAQAVIDAKQATLNKLMALGLTETEALALGK
jgi:hypothetical protein